MLRLFFTSGTFTDTIPYSSASGIVCISADVNTYRTSVGAAHRRSYIDTCTIASEREKDV